MNTNDGLFEIINEDDFEIPAGDSVILIDSMSAQYLNDAVVDFIDDLQGARFSISNPQAKTTCGYRDWETDRKSTRLNSSHRL